MVTKGDVMLLRC